MAHYRARVAEIKKATIDHGRKPTGSDIAKATAVPVPTVNAMLNGRPVNGKTMAKTVHYYGGRVEDWFELVIDDEQAP